MPGRRIHADFDGNGSFEDFDVRQPTDADNQINQVTASVGTSTIPTKSFAHDHAGNMVLDGDRVYQYDAFNRLVRVSKKGTVTVGSGGNTSGTPGQWLVYYTYDGLGRMICKQMPWPNADNPTHENNGDIQVHVERYYYDGVRRIQEVWTDPIHTTEIEPGGGEVEPEGIPGGEPLPQGEIEAASQELTGGAVGAPIGQPIGAQTWVNREYVYGPGTQLGIDEFVVQFDATNTPFYILQDASTDVAAITDGNGTVLEQYTWDPYGEALTVETFGTVLVNKVGHHGLFHDRLDAGIVQTSTGGSYVADSPQIVVQSQPNASNPTFSICYNRNRFYVPSLGRFANKDPNTSGGPLMREDFNSLPSIMLQYEERYNDGPNLFAYLRSQPSAGTDPRGLGFMIDLAASAYARAPMIGTGIVGLARFQQQISQVIMMNASRMAVIADMADNICSEYTGSPGTLQANIQIIQSVLKLPGPKSKLLEFTAENFRHNLINLTGFKNAADLAFFDAHHILPKEFNYLLEKLGVGYLANNPLFGQWVKHAEHVALHADGKYNSEWGKFLEKLLKDGVRDNEALGEIISRVQKLGQEYDWQIPLFK